MNWRSDVHHLFEDRVYHILDRVLLYPCELGCNSLVVLPCFVIIQGEIWTYGVVDLIRGDIHVRIASGDDLEGLVKKANSSHLNLWSLAKLL